MDAMAIFSVATSDRVVAQFPILRRTKLIHHAGKLLDDDDNADEEKVRASLGTDRVDFFVGNVYQANEELLSTLQDTTLAVCFATTWSQMNNIDESGGVKKKTSLDGRRLPQLSLALTALPVGARVVIVDGKLDEKDGYAWEGDLRIYCPDTAPFSIASLYVRR